MYLIIDTETTGLPEIIPFNKYYPYTNNTKYDNARLVQVSWQILDQEFKELCVKDFIIKRDGFNITNSQFHGINNEISDTNGYELNYVMDILKKDLGKCTTIIAHNLIFDYNILMNHFYRYNRQDIINILSNKNQYCTMLNSINVLKIPMRYSNNYKATSLNEVYQYFFNKNVENAHNAVYDVKACAECFIKLINL